MEKKIAALRAKISEQKRSAQIFEKLFSHTVNAVAILDKQLDFILVNESFAQDSRRPAADFPGHHFFDLIVDEPYRLLFQRVLESKENQTLSAQAFPGNEHNGGSAYRDLTLIPVLDDSEEVDILILISNNVTDHILAREELAASEDRYRAIYENSLVGIILGTAEGQILSANPAACRIFGWSEAELIARGRPGIVDINDPRLIEILKEREEKGSFHRELNLIRRDGTKFPGEVSSKVFRDRDGRLLANFVVRDISENKKAEAALRSSEEVFNQAFNANPLAMAIVTAKEGRIIKVNSTFGNRTGYREELLQPGSTDHKLWAVPGEREVFMRQVQREGAVRNAEVSIRAKTGEVLPVLLSGVAIEWKGEACVLSVANDITELRRYQLEVARLDRLNMIGEMAASIAHEIRNPMTTVRGFLQLFENRPEFWEERLNIQLMIEEMDRANMIITQFLNMAKNKAVQRQPINLNENIQSIMPLLQAKAMKHDVSIELDLSPIPDLLLDKNEMHQLMLNLVLNGIDAMPQGGTLTIRTRVENSSVILAIYDQGIGMNQETLQKLGTPFFTTKSEGTGLGLAVCYSIAQRHQARIEAESDSQGSVFKVIFPVPSRD